ncbi:MAG: hypothetical protein QOJ40_58 [Verrucomicrobiota bacterium]
MADQKPHRHYRAKYQRCNHYRIPRPKGELGFAAYWRDGLFVESTGTAASFQKFFFHARL